MICKKAFTNSAEYWQEAQKASRVQLKGEQFSVVPWCKRARLKLKFKTLQRESASRMGALKIYSPGMWAKPDADGDFPGVQSRSVMEWIEASARLWSHPEDNIIQSLHIFSHIKSITQSHFWACKEIRAKRGNNKQLKLASTMPELLQYQQAAPRMWLVFKDIEERVKT